jgi:hypothetical protein
MMGRAMMALGEEEVQAATTAKGTSSSNSSSDSTTSSTKGANCTAGDGFPKRLPNSTYEERIGFLNELLEQGQQGSLINGTTACGPWAAYFDFTVQLMTYMLGNIGSGFGRIAGTSVGMAAGASIGQSGGMVGGAAVSTVLMPAEEAALGQGTGPGGQGGQRRGSEQQVEAKQEQESRRQRGRQRQQQSTQPIEDATIGLAGASGIGLGTGFAIGTPAGAAAGRKYGKKIGQEVALWIINNANFAIAYFGTLVLADVMNGIDLIVTDGISRVKIQNIFRSQIQKIEDQILQDFTSVYNATLYADFANLELESAVFQSTVDAFGGMGVLFGFAAGMPVGAAVGASGGGIYGSSGAGAASGAAQAAGTNTRRRKAQTMTSSSLAEELAAIDPLVAIATSMWMGTSIGVGTGTAIGVGAGISGGWQLTTKIGYGMGLLMVKFLVKAFAVFQQVYGQAVVNQIEQAIFDSSAIRINITYTPTCDFSNYTYPVQDISFYVSGNLSACDFTASKTEGDKKAGASGAAAASGEEKEIPTDLAALLQLLGSAAILAKKGAPAPPAFYSRTAASFQSAVAATETRGKRIRAAYDACQNYAISEMYRQKSRCFEKEI